MRYRIKNWAKHQHFKDRTPPWVKLYRDILDDPDWHELSGDDAKTLISLWLIASEDKDMNGGLPDVRKLAFRLRTKEAQLKQALTRLSNWVLQDDISVISERYQVDAPETETEREKKRQRTETERESETEAEERRIPPPPVGAVDGNAMTVSASKPKPSSETWEKYSGSYERRYGVMPVRNAKVNAQLVQLVKRLGDEAPHVAEYYVGHPGALYTSAAHCTDLLVRDAEKLRTEWATQRRVTQQAAQAADKRATTAQAFKDFEQRLQQHEGKTYEHG